MRYIIVLVLIFITYSLNAEEWEDQRVFSSGSTNQTLRILSSTDTSFFEPILKSYLVKYDRQPIRFTFQFYKPNKEWRIHSFKYDGNIDDEIEEAAKLYYFKLD